MKFSLNATLRAVISFPRSRSYNRIPLDVFSCKSSALKFLLVLLLLQNYVRACSAHPHSRKSRTAIHRSRSKSKREHPQDCRDGLAAFTTPSCNCRARRVLRVFVQHLCGCSRNRLRKFARCFLLPPPPPSPRTCCCHR